jgi:hypothetical protein
MNLIASTLFLFPWHPSLRHNGNSPAKPSGCYGSVFYSISYEIIEKRKSKSWASQSGKFYMPIKQSLEKQMRMDAQRTDLKGW